VSARISQKVAVGVVFVAAMFVSIMDATIVNVALPTIGRDFKVSATAASIGLLGPQTSLWWARLLMLTLGLFMAQVFVPVQAASFATITPAATGRASTMFNAIRQLGGAIGVALLTTVIVFVGPVHLVAGHAVPNLTAYRVAFLAAAAICLCAVGCSLSIRDADAAATIPARRSRPAIEPTAEPSAAA